MADENEPEVVDGSGFTLKGVDIPIPQGVFYSLDGPTIARLAHLEAIEAATAKMDSFVLVERDRRSVDMRLYFEAENILLNLIRKGVKDNG